MARPQKRRCHWIGRIAQHPRRVKELRLLIYTFWKSRHTKGQPMARILVIDDESDIRAMLEQALEAAGHEVVLAADGRQGVMQHRASPSDLVITDLYMPIQNGFETIRELRSHFPRLPIIAITGRSDSEMLLSIAQNLAAVGILTKPFLPEQLIAAVARALGRQSFEN